MLEAVWFGIICVFSLGFQKRNAKETIINLVFKGRNQIILYYKPRWTNGINRSHCTVARGRIFPISRLNSSGLNPCQKPDLTKLLKVPHIYTTKPFCDLRLQIQKRQNLKTIYLNMFSYVKWDFLTYSVISHYLGAHSLT